MTQPHDQNPRLPPESGAFPPPPDPSPLRYARIFAVHVRALLVIFFWTGVGILGLGGLYILLRVVSVYAQILLRVLGIP